MENIYGEYVLDFSRNAWTLTNAKDMTNVRKYKSKVIASLGHCLQK